MTPSYNNLQCQGRAKYFLGILLLLAPGLVVVVSKALVVDDTRAFITALGETSLCTTDEDCSLNGVCKKTRAFSPGDDNGDVGVCECDRPWTGPGCGVLAFKPLAIAPMGGAPAYGGATNSTFNYSTWGGNAVLYKNQYHLFVARIPGTLALWYNTSRIDYAVASTPEGPYTFQKVVLPVFAHNPQIVHQKFKNGTEKFVLFHIGQGGIHASSAPDQPFVTVPPGNWSCDNPAPFWDAPEETWYVTCRTKKQGMRTAKSLEGPWTQVGASPSTPSSAGPGTWFEDPYLYKDGRGNWHALFHAVNLNVMEHCGASPVSAHAFSRDLTTWNTLPQYVQPYTSVVQLSNGANWTLSTVERPKFLFNERQQPTHLFNGASNVPACHNIRPCTDCKYLDHTMTLVRPLDV